MNDGGELIAGILSVFDFLLGGLLRLPRDATLVVVTLLTVVTLVLVRRFTTDQERLRRTAADLARLKQLRRAARQRGDRDALQRLARTATTVKLVRFKADLIVLAVAIVPLGLLATWAVERLDYLPARANQRLVVTAYYSLSSVDRLTHLVPRPDMTLESPALQLVQLDTAHGRGTASWTFRPQVDNDQFLLVVRHAGEQGLHPVRIGGAYYAPAELTHAPNERLLETRVSLERFKFLGLDPHLEAYGLAPWLAAYVVLSLLLMPLVRRVLRTA